MPSKPPRKRLTPPSVPLRTLREAHGLSQAQLAERMGDHLGKAVDPDTISNIERGWKRPSGPLLHAWAKSLGILAPDITVADGHASQVEAVA